MATSSVEICNSALILIGAQTISALSDTSKAAKICNLEYDKVRRAVLSEHPWNFAMNRKELAATANTPVFKFSKEYVVPSDVLRILSTNLDPAFSAIAPDGGSYNVAKSDEWKVEQNKDGNTVVVSNSSTMKILYMKDITDVTRFPAYFEEALAYRLAARIAFSVTQSRQLTLDLIKAADFYMARARSYDAQESSIETYQANEWIDVRG